MVTRAYHSANPNMMKHTTNLSERIKRAREACLVFLWLLDHPEQIDPEMILKRSPQFIRKSTKGE